eukprot:2294962-Lingulodinium_polyedra.AAC.1
MEFWSGSTAAVLLLLSRWQHTLKQKESRENARAMLHSIVHAGVPKEHAWAVRLEPGGHFIEDCSPTGL